MKQLLTALLIAILVFGCKGNAQIKEFYSDSLCIIKEFYSDSLCIMKIVDNRAVCYLMCMGENQKLNYYFDCKKIMPVPKPSPLPDTTKPIKIKMQPRWREEDSVRIYLPPYPCHYDHDKDGYFTKEEYLNYRWALLFYYIFCLKP